MATCPCDLSLGFSNHHILNRCVCGLISRDLRSPALPCSPVSSISLVLDGSGEMAAESDLARAGAGIMDGATTNRTEHAQRAVSGGEPSQIQIQVQDTGERLAVQVKEEQVTGLLYTTSLPP